MKKRLSLLVLLSSCMLNGAAHDFSSSLLDVLQSGNLEVIYLLLEHDADVNARNVEGKTPLHLAAWYNHSRAAQILLNNGAHINSQNNKGYTPLHMTALRGYEHITYILLNHGAHVDIQDFKGNTPLHWATFFGHQDVAQVLFERGANPQIENKNGKTPLDLAKTAKNEFLIQLYNSTTSANKTRPICVTL